MSNQWLTTTANRLVDLQTDSIVLVKWVGALTASHFIHNNSAARALRSAFASDDQWRILSIGMHDIFGLCRASAQGRYRPAFNQLVDYYQSIFSSFGNSGKFGWLISPQQLIGPAVCGLSERSVYEISEEFNQAVSVWCHNQGIIVVNPLPMLLDSNFHPKKDMVQKDGIHLNINAIETYRLLIEENTGQKLACRKLIQNRKHPVQARTEPESLALLVADELNLKWDDSGVPPGQRLVFEQQIITHIANRLTSEGLQANLDRNLPYNADGQLNTADLIGIYSYASDLFGREINFDVNIRDLDTVAKISRFLLTQKPLTKNDFFETLRADTNDAVRESEIRLADQRISKINDSGWMQLKEIFHHQTEGSPCQYGIFYFWLALIEAQKGHHGLALHLLENACCHHRRFPFRSQRADYYRSIWKQQRYGSEDVDNSSLGASNRAKTSCISGESTPVATQHAASLELLFSALMNQEDCLNENIHHLYAVTNEKSIQFYFDCFPKLKSLELFIPVPDTCKQVRQAYRNDPRVRVWPFMLSDRSGYDLVHFSSQNQPEVLSFFCQNPDIVRTIISVESIGIDDFLSHYNGNPPDILIFSLLGMAPRLWGSFSAPALTNIKAVCTAIDRNSPPSASQVKGFILFGTAPMHTPQNGYSMAELYLNPMHAPSLMDRQATLHTILAAATPNNCLQSMANHRLEDEAQDKRRRLNPCNVETAAQ